MIASPEPGAAKMPFTSREKQKAATREVGYRQHVYPRRVSDGKMKQADADKQIAIMQEIADDYARLAEVEEAKERLI